MLPPNPQWDVIDFGLGDWRQYGLVLVTLANEPEYCEKVMYACRGMTTPAHCHHRKKEDIIARWGRLRVTLWDGLPSAGPGRVVDLDPGMRITIPSGVYHEFVPLTDECIIGEVSTANDDAHDNVFADPRIARFPHIEQDEAPLIQLVGH